MPILANARYELFAQELAKGTPQGKAFVAAGFTANTGNAVRLSDRPEVKARVQELLNEAADETICTLRDIANQLDEDRQFARDLENPSAAISATMGKAKVLGLIADKVEHTGKDGGPIETVDISDTEKARRIAFTLMRGTQQPTQH